MAEEHGIDDGESAAASAALAARSVCSGERLDPAGMRLLGPIGGNVTFALPRERVVLRMSPAAHAERAARELALARWLLAEGLPVVQPLSAAPAAHHGWVVTLWRQVPDPSMASARELGALLRRLHAVAAPAGLELPSLEPLAGVEDYLAAAHGLDPADLMFLRRRAEELRDAYTGLDFALPQGLVHGDAHRKNAVRGPDGSAVLLDLERMAVGPREWDLVVAAAYAHLGWYSPQDYADFVDAYGFDVRDWPGCATLLQMRLVRMTAWLCARTGRQPRLRTEAAHRIASLRRRDAQPQWRPGT